MNRNVYGNIVLTLLLGAVIFFGVMIVNALDRVHAALRELAADGGVRTAAVPVTQKPASAVKNAAPVANREFFDPAAEPGGRLVQAISADTQNLNHLINADAYVAAFHGLANSCLGARNYAKPEEWAPLMAEKWTVSEDCKTYHIYLRKGILWQDFTDPVTGKKWQNKEVTAADFKFFIDLIRNPDVNCEQWRDYYRDLDDLEIINPYEFLVRWKEPFYGSKSFTLGMSPMPRHLYEDYAEPFDGKRFNEDHQRNRILVGCGPYQLVRWEKDVRVIFKRFEKYFGSRFGVAPALDNIVFELIRLPNSRFQALTAGKLDLLSLTPDQWINRTGIPAFQDGTLRKYSYLSRSFTYIGYNLRNPLFADVRVRRALTMLVDREKILKDVYFGLGVVTPGPFFPESPYADPAVKPWPFDVEGAGKLLAEAGWKDVDGDGVLEKDGKKFIFTILQVASHPIQQRMLPMIKETMAQAGIQMQILPVEWSVMLQRIDRRNFEACTLGWTISLDPDMFQLFHSSLAEKEGSGNLVGYQNKEVDRLIEQLRRTFDESERVKICRQIGAIFHEDQPYTFLFTPSSLLALSGRYRNARMFPGGLAEDLLWTPRAEQRKVPGL